MDPTDCVCCRVRNRTDSRFGSDGKEGPPRGREVVSKFLRFQLKKFVNAGSFSFFFSSC